MMSFMLKMIDNFNYWFKSSVCVGIDVNILLIIYFWWRNIIWRYNYVRMSRRRDIGKVKVSQFMYVMLDEDFLYLVQKLK